MSNLRFDNIVLSGFSSFKFAEKQRKPRIGIKRLTKLVQGLCVIEDDNYKILLREDIIKPYLKESDDKSYYSIPFSEESYNLKGMLSVFSRIPDDKGKYTRYIRTETQARFSPGNPDVFVPFCKNWICSGYIIKKDKDLLFEFHECLWPKGYIPNNRDELK